MTDLGYISLDRLTLQQAEQAQEADSCSGVVRHAPTTAAERVRERIARQAQAVAVKQRWREAVDG